MDYVHLDHAVPKVSECCGGPLAASVIKQDGAITMSCGSCGHVWRVDTREPLLLKCPRCGKPLAILKAPNGTGKTYHCPVDGRFWLMMGARYARNGAHQNARNKPGMLNVVRRPMPLLGTKCPQCQQTNALRL
jgi:phage FluMu protein Com